jgi:hypothetical protein
VTPEFIKRVKRDYEAEKSNLDWDSYLVGYLACLRRFGSQQEKNKHNTKQIQGV